MKEINTYIIEKLVINDNVRKKRDPMDDWNARTFKKDDIIYVHPNISAGLHKPSKGGKPTFLKVLDNNGKRLKVVNIGSEYVKRDEKSGSVIPDKRDMLKTYDSFYVRIDKDGFAWYGSMVLYAWDGEKIDYWL